MSAAPKPTHLLLWLPLLLPLLPGCKRDQPTDPVPVVAPVTNADTNANTPSVPPLPPLKPPPGLPPEETQAWQLLLDRWPDAPRSGPQAMQHLRTARHALPSRGKHRRFLLVYASRPVYEDCNACSPYLSFFEFESAGPGKPPTLLHAYVAAEQLGYAGEAPQSKIRRLPGGRYAVFLHWQAFAQGMTDIQVLMKPVEGRMRIYWLMQTEDF